MSRTGRQADHTADVVIRWSTATVVVGVAAVAAYVSYQHARELVAAHGETGATARLVPLTVDGLVYASSMAMLDSARQGRSMPRLARYLLALGVAATLAANVAHGAGGGPIGAAVAAWPAVALVGSYELLMTIVRGRGRTTQDIRQDIGGENARLPVAENQSTVDRRATQDRHEFREDNQNSPQGSDDDFTKSLATARMIADEYRRKHGRWIPRDELRTRMRCSTERAAELLRDLKASEPFNVDGKGGDDTT